MCIFYLYFFYLSVESEILKLEFFVDIKFNWFWLSVSSIKVMKWVKVVFKFGLIMFVIVKYYD